jgi:hypothetical protein
MKYNNLINLRVILLYRIQKIKDNKFKIRIKIDKY